MFNWKIKQKITASNAIYLEDSNGQEGRPFKARFLQAGLVKYDFGVCLLKKETIDKFVDTFLGKPVIIDHKDYISPEDRKGIIEKIWFNPDDGWFWCSGTMTDEQAIEFVEKGYNVSCQYAITDFSVNTEGKLHNGNPYDKEILDGNFEHLAIVENPRYEDAFIAVNAYIACNQEKTMDKDKNLEWITVRGTHIPIRKGQSKDEAVEEFLNKKDKFELTEKNQERIQKQKDARHSAILSKELPGLRNKLSQLITKRYKSREKNIDTTFLDKEIEKTESEIEKLKKEASSLREDREKYIKENQPKYSTSKEHQEKVEKGTKKLDEVDWKQWLKDRAKNNKDKYKPVFDYIRTTKGEPMDKETKGVFDQLLDALKARNEAEDETKDKKGDEAENKAKNEDKRKIIDEVGGILKGKVDDEIIRTVIGKLEKLAYEPSEDSKADNKAKNEDDKENKEDKKDDKPAENKCKNEDGEDNTDYKKLYEELKEKTAEEAENKKAKNALDKAVNEIYDAVMPKGDDLYISPQKGLELGKKIYG